MPRISSGKRYAQAAFELALERDELESWQEGLKKISSITTQEDLMDFLQSPRLPFEAKKELLHKHLGKIHPLAFNLILLLVNKGSLRLAGNILQEYLALLDAHRGVDRAKVIAAVSFSEEARASVSERLGKMVGRKVVIDDTVDPSILGGFIARVGDLLIDGSIRQKLESLKKNLIEGRR